MRVEPESSPKAVRVLKSPERQAVQQLAEEPVPPEADDKSEAEEPFDPEKVC